MLPAGQQVGEKGMSAMGRLKVWLNQKIANILGDLQEQKPVEDPSPARAGCRIFFMVSLLVGFSSLLVYNFIDAPDTRVVEMHHVRDHVHADKNREFLSCFMNNKNLPKCKKWSEAKFPQEIHVSCQCTNTNAPWPSWKTFVNFHVLHENSEDWKMEFRVPGSQPGVKTQHNEAGNEASNEGALSHPKYPTLPGVNPEITLPDVDIPLGNESIVKDTEILTAEKFCTLSYLGPIAMNSTTSPGMVVHEDKKVADDSIFLEHCVWMATLLFPQFPGSSVDYEDRTRSTRSLNTPSLLNGEELNTLLAQLARESVLRRRLALDMVLSLDPSNEDFRRFYNALAHLLTGLLDRDEMDPNTSYVYGAEELSYTLRSNLFYDKNAIVWYLKDDLGPIFLQPEIDWEAYCRSCNPEYCDVTKPMEETQKLYRALGILGGVATIVLAVVTTLLWPCTAMLLLWISKRKAAAMVMLLHWISNLKAAAMVIILWISNLKAAAMVIILWISKRKTVEKGGPGTPQVATVAGT